MARPKPDSLDIPWRLTDPCPCGTGQAYQTCCYNAADKLPLCKIGSLSPPGQETGFENAKCYLKFTKNCSPKITREHYVSAAVLSLFEGLQIEGMPWQEPGEKSSLSLTNLASKILCDRHNSALAPLDAAAGHAFEQISNAIAHALKKSVSRASKYFLVNGDALELWGLKTLLGLFHAKIARDKGVPMIDNFQFDNQLAYAALFGPGVPDPLGIYIHPEVGGIVENKIGFAGLSSPGGEFLSGLRLQAHGIFIDFIFDPREGNPEFFKVKQYYRPWVLDFTGKKRTSRIIFSWARRRVQATRVNIEFARR